MESNVKELDITNKKNGFGLKDLINLLTLFEFPNSTRGILGGTNLFSMYVTITPSVAKRLLEFNTTNRPLSKINVRTLSKEISLGNWQFDGQPIRFDSNGRLIDGQHRLQALIETDTDLTFLVLIGLDEEVFKILDTGRKRTASDAFHIEDIPNSTQAAAATNFIYAFRNGKYSANRNQNRTLSNTDLLAYYKSLDGIQESIKFANRVKSQGHNLYPFSLLIGIHYLLGEIDKGLRDDFMNQMATGIQVENRSPVMALRNKVLKSKLDKNYRLTNKELLENITYAWDKFINNQKVSKLKLPKDYVINL